MLIREDDEKYDNVAEGEVEDDGVAKYGVEHDDDVKDDGFKWEDDDDDGGGGDDDDDDENDDVEEEDDDVEDDEDDRSQDRAARFERACAVEMHRRNLQVKCRRPRAWQCEPAQSKCTWAHKSHFTQKFTGKIPQTKSKPNSRRTFCLSLRSRNAHGHLTRASLEQFIAILYENLQEKGREAQVSTSIKHRPELLP